MQTIEHYRDLFEKYLNSQVIDKQPANLYSPISYIIKIGGKRMRPILTLMAADIFDEDPQEAAAAAMAVEMFHNFSLVHDDIMDDAPLRRGNVTVHEKWNINTAILSGDAMLILAYQYFEKYEPVVFQDLAKLFSKTAIEVCEGQQLDVDFENREDVRLDEYLKMIEYKTAVLVGAALKMGAIIAKTSVENCDAIYQFGLHLGIAFQLQDDYLDAFGNPETFGKQVGGDIIENKKTYLYLKAHEYASDSERESLDQLYSIQPSVPKAKIESINKLFVSTGAADATLEAIKNYTLSAFEVLETMDISNDKKDILKNVGNRLMGRKV